NPGNASNLYRFDASAGDHFYFDYQSVTNTNVNWRLIDLTGQQVWSNSFYLGDVDTPALGLTGTYTLLVEGSVSNGGTIAYSFNAQKVTDTTAALSLGQQVNGSIAQVGQQSNYTFALAIPTQLYFDSLTNDTSLSWSLTGPRGAEISARNFTNSDGASVTNPV